MPPVLTRRAKVMLPLCLLLLAGLSVHRLWFAAEPPANDPIRLSGKTMGTTWTVLVAGLETTRRLDVTNRVEAELGRLQQLMSTYDKGSELSRFNQLRSEEPFAVSEDTAKVVAAAQKISIETAGAFDATVGPLVALWGFGAEARVKAPTVEEIRQARVSVGFEKLKLALKPATLTKIQPDIALDLSAIAKGYAVDRIAELLGSLDLANHFVEIGGEVRVSGVKTSGAPWRVGIERPDSEQRVVTRSLALRDLAVATSGDYRNYYERAGERITHTIDPRDGRPVRHQLASVTVVHRSAMLADGYATALSVLGPQAGWQFAEEKKLAALFLVRSEGEFVARSTPAFDAVGGGG